MTPLELTYLNGPDVDRLALGDDEILDAVEAALRAQGEGETVLEPRVHLRPDPAVDGHFNVLRGAVRPLGLAGVKVVGDFHGNYRHGLCAAAAEHRVGRVPLSEPSVIVAVSAAHRGEAFAGAREIIDAIKARAPIWKTEEGEWVEGAPPPTP